MSDKQAAVIYRRVTRSANGFAIMKKQHLSSFVAGQGTLVPYVFMCFLTNFQNDLLRASNFKLTHTPAIYGEHGIIAHIP